ncbi:MAG: UDP-N-acetylglucosamine 2-epimerase (hydrolyzing) [Bacteroidales bacterium]|nr:UDP-N-acetylglucosamine 2-epimerase (hydrolyzing) [Bacteroidales bacterium]
MKKLCIVTTTRAEYGLLFWLMKGIQDDSDLQLQLVVTGTHLSVEFGSTIDQIREDGFHIDRSFNMELKDDSAIGITHSISVALEGFSTSFKTLQPDLIILLGDRFEILAAATSALIANIPLAHIHGGELSLGAIDDTIRHSVSKMSNWHFTAAEAYRKRVIQLGENPSRVFNVGGFGQDSIKKLPLLSKKELQQNLGIKFKSQNLLLTYHPETLDPKESLQHFKDLLTFLADQKDCLCIFTMPNADAGHRELIELLQQYTEDHPDSSKLFASLGQLRYLSLMKQVDAVVGNSSSGIIEAPSVKTATINIGNRQKGRLSAQSVIHTNPDPESLKKAFKKLYSEKFQKSLSNTKNPYGNGGATEKTLKLLKSFNLAEVKPKDFYDINQ